MDKIKLSLPVIVEGKYDKIALSAVADAHIVTTDGFGIFNSREKRALISRISENGIIVMCDSDSAGGVIRAHLSGIVPKDRLLQLYVPCIKGKERRKSAPSKEGLLGVEGMSAEILRERILALAEIHPEILGGEAVTREEITKGDLYELGLSGGENAAEKRDYVAAKAGLPSGMTAKALLAALNTVMTRTEFLKLVTGDTDDKQN
ncbi:MAG: DUF4093 domain-containing protein [Clostridia bacterium]|nr:DUF4093 domain-containing protein [Clostridia bacterium]